MSKSFSLLKIKRGISGRSKWKEGVTEHRRGITPFKDYSNCCLEKGLDNGMQVGQIGGYYNRKGKRCWYWRWLDWRKIYIYIYIQIYRALCLMLNFTFKVREMVWERMLPGLLVRINGIGVIQRDPSFVR